VLYRMFGNVSLGELGCFILYILGASDWVMTVVLYRIFGSVLFLMFWGIFLGKTSYIIELRKNLTE
jgi:hypothetical protein